MLTVRFPSERITYPAKEEFGDPFNWGLFMYILVQVVSAGYNIWWGIRAAKQQVGTPTRADVEQGVKELKKLFPTIPESKLRAALIAPVGQEEKAAQEAEKTPTWVWIVIGLLGFMLLMRNRELIEF